MEELIKNIEIEDFINIRILELEYNKYIYFVEDYNKKYFYINNDNELRTHQYIPTKYSLYCQKAITISYNKLNELEKEVYKLYRQLTFKIERAKKGKTYYFINTHFEAKLLVEENCSTDNELYKSFNYFVSEEEAQKCAGILCKTLRELRKEYYLKGE